MKMLSLGVEQVLLNDELRAAFLDLGVIPAILRLLKVARNKH